MRTIFDTDRREALIARLGKLSPAATAEWGKMNAFQMLRHCSLSEEMFHGRKEYKRLFIGRLFGKMALKGILSNACASKRNQPTHPDLVIRTNGDFEPERERWIALLKGYEQYKAETFLHPFFGRMNKQQVGEFVYKHTDHHLRQFGV